MTKFCILLVAVCIFPNVTGSANLSEQLGDDDVSNSIECREYHKLVNASHTDICAFVNETDDCQMDEGFVNYIRFALCSSQSLPGVYVLYIIWLLYLFIALGTTAESFLCPALEFIAHNLKLSHNIAGVTVVAFGNGAPDIFSAVAAFTHSNPSSSGVAIGALLGAGVFVTTVVAGSVSIATPFEMAQRPFLRDVVFYLATVFWAFCLLYKGEIDLKSSIGFLILYLVYVVVVLLGRYINQKIRKRSNNNEKSDGGDGTYDETSPLINNADRNEPVLRPTDADGDWIEQPLRGANEHNRDWKEEHKNINENLKEISSDEDVLISGETHSRWGKVWSLIHPINVEQWSKTPFLFKIIEILQVPIKLFCNLTVPVVSSEPGVNDWSRTLACIHCVLSPIFCLFAAEGAFIDIGGVFPLWALFLIIGVVLAVIVFFTSEEMERPRYYWAFAYIGFVASVIWTYCIANEIVNLLQTFGALLNVSNVIMGLTLLAWGNSIGDVVADVTLAKQGFPRMAISACFGGPFFNLIIGIGLPCTIANISNGHPIVVKFTLLEAFLVGSLLFSLICSFVIIPLRQFKMTRAYGILLLVIYAIYLPVVILIGTGVLG